MSAGTTSPEPAPDGPAQPVQAQNSPELNAIQDMTDDLVKAGLLTADHQATILQSTAAAIQKIDDLRSRLGSSLDERSWGFVSSSSSKATPQFAATRQQLLDSLGGTVLNISRIQSVFASLSNEGQDAAQKSITMILDRLMAVLDDFKKHFQYQNWAVSFVGGFPLTFQVGVQITFQ